MSTLNKDELGQLAKFKMLMRKVHQHSVDLSLFVSDASYAKETLDLAEDTDDEDLMMLAIEIRSQFGLLQAQPTLPTEQATPAAEPAPEAAQPESESAKSAVQPNEPPEDRYKFSLR